MSPLRPSWIVFIPEHIVAVSGKDGLVMGLKCLWILLQTTESGLAYETRFSRVLVHSSDSDSDGGDAEIRSNNSPDQAIPIPTYDPGVNNREYPGLLGYEIEFPENLNLGIQTNLFISNARVRQLHCL